MEQLFKLIQNGDFENIKKILSDRYELNNIFDDLKILDLSLICTPVGSKVTIKLY